MRAWIATAPQLSGIDDSLWRGIGLVAFFVAGQPVGVLFASSRAAFAVCITSFLRVWMRVGWILPGSGSVLGSDCIHVTKAFVGFAFDTGCIEWGVRSPVTVTHDERSDSRCCFRRQLITLKRIREFWFTACRW